MLRRTIELSTPGTRLSVAHRQLVVERPDLPEATLPIEDLGVVIVDDARASFTQAVFIELLEAGATVMVTGRNHLPLGMMLPLDAHHVQTERHRAQVDASEPTRKQVWKALIAAKLEQQGAVLANFAGEDAGLAAMAGRVRSGDPENLEAQGAQRYWPRLFGAGFRRDRDAEGINAMLNYGYAVLRAAIARAIVASGLIPSLGVHHRNRSNPFCLADDLLEPFRPYVDWRVKLAVDSSGKAPSLDDRDTRGALLSLFNETVMIGERRLPLLLALQASAASLSRILTAQDGSKAEPLLLPEGLPLGPDEGGDG
ncbi:MAG TPA: type II CRISPR-associated endonuclease Cas1 [Hyphomonadaceae bacterium]|nr:type II CRISPR-associated endonuclease Cas1 [Hyphomonadaceae bacterium]